MYVLSVFKSYEMLITIYDIEHTLHCQHPYVLIRLVLFGLWVLIQGLFSSKRSSRFWVKHNHD